MSKCGIKIREGTGATMSDEEDEFETESNQGTSESSAGGQDTFGFGPLLPTESERTLMERVRQELKIELKQGYKLKLEKVRDEILRKRKAGKLPNDMTSVLKNWWQQHSRWPYPTIFISRYKLKEKPSYWGNKLDIDLVHENLYIRCMEL
ncbi:hypothetical protein AMTR_s00023p00178300 [Amborella trichopoda]|uniref:ELK domain-containing protein n=1 Tax=Amborella trichopoda TaxID=13333 RepID=W1NIP9_AMBTC|nr:hypothetical protein AMTR_s00023p00178300 [Amborella trichopoda]